jgi:hypothetical protein
LWLPFVFCHPKYRAAPADVVAIGRRFLMTIEFENGLLSLLRV